jgi:hypothetical protein
VSDWKNSTSSTSITRTWRPTLAEEARQIVQHPAQRDIEEPHLDQGQRQRRPDTVSEDTAYELPALVDQRAVVEPGREDGKDEGDSEYVGGEDRGDHAQARHQQRRQHPAQAEQQDQFGQRPVAAAAAVGQAEFIQLAAFDRRHAGDPFRHVAPAVGLRHGRPRRLLEHAEQFVFPFPMPGHHLAPATITV